MINEEAMTKTTHQLQRVYKKALVQSRGMMSARQDIFPAVIEAKANYCYRKDNRKQFRNTSFSAWMVASGGQKNLAWSSANIATSLVTKRMSEAEGLRREAALKGLNGTKVGQRLYEEAKRRELNLSKEVNYYVKDEATRAEQMMAGKGEAHQYTIKGVQTKENAVIRSVLHSIEGANSLDKVDVLLRNQSENGVKNPDHLIFYATEKAQQKGYQNGLKMTVRELESYALDDSKKLGLSVEVGSFEEKEKPILKQKEPTVGKKEIVGAVMALNNVKDELSLKNLNLGSNRNLLPFKHELTAGQGRVSDLRKIIDQHTKRLGLEELVKAVKTELNKPLVKENSAPEVQKKEVGQSR